MKKIEKRALTLRTETISNLSADKLRNVNGGWTTIVISVQVQDWTTIMVSSGLDTKAVKPGG